MPEPALPTIAVQPHAEAIVASVTCRELRHDTIQQFRQDLDTALGSAPELPLILDLSGVDFVPSLALGIMVNTHKALKLAGRKCLLVGIRPFVLEAMQVTALDRFFEIHSTIDEGLKHL